jgi:hypothetical protein
MVTRRPAYRKRYDPRTDDPHCRSCRGRGTNGWRDKEVVANYNLTCKRAEPLF